MSMVILSVPDLVRLMDTNQPYLEALGRAFQQFADKMNEMFPKGVAAYIAQRETASRVHTQYRQKRGKRW